MRQMGEEEEGGGQGRKPSSHQPAGWGALLMLIGIWQLIIVALFIKDTDQHGAGLSLSLPEALTQLLQVALMETVQLWAFEL